MRTHKPEWYTAVHQFQTCSQLLACRLSCSHFINFFINWVTSVINFTLTVHLVSASRTDSVTLCESVYHLSDYWITCYEISSLGMNLNSCSDPWTLHLTSSSIIDFNLSTTFFFTPNIGKTNGAPLFFVCATDMITARKDGDYKHYTAKRASLWAC